MSTHSHDYIPAAGHDRLLRFYEQALMGYTYLEDPNVD